MKWFRFSLKVEGLDEPWVSWEKCDPGREKEAVADYARRHLKGKLWSLEHIVPV